MNQEKFQTFSDAYKVGLEAAVRADPDQYYTRGATPAEYAGVVSKRMMTSIAASPMGVNYSGGGFSRACRAVGIKHTRKAILAYLEIV